MVNYLSCKIAKQFLIPSFKHEDFMLLSVLYHSKFNIVEFWSAGWKKTANCDAHVSLF